jgi:gluconolactonase
VYVANNGGAVGPFRSEDFGPGSIQKVSFSGVTKTVAREIAGIQLNMPNDLVFGRDKRLYFTDPGRWDDANRPDPGRLFVLNPDGSGELFADVGNSYPNGIVVEADGSVVWVETYTQKVRRRALDGTMRDICQLPSNAYPDGLAVAANGDLYISTLSSGGMHVVAPDGSSIRFLDLDGTILSNCVFEGSTMFVTDMGGPAGVTPHAVAIGKLWKIETETEGMPMFRGAVAAR